MTTTVDMVALEAEWAKAKIAEIAAKEQRLAIEEEILKHISHPSEGTVNVTDELRVRFGYDRKVDVEQLQTLWTSLTAAQQEAFKWKAEVSVAALRKVPSDQQAMLHRVITVKPAKPSFSLKD